MSANTNTIASLLQNLRTIAVVGLSPKTHRISHEVASYMQQQGYRIIPINPLASEVLGEKAYPSLLEAAQHEKIELVNCFRNSPDIPPAVDEAITIGAKAVWMQLGISHTEAAAKAKAAGIEVVEDRCIMVEHARLLARGML
jgi:hypothetical protein